MPRLSDQAKITLSSS